MDEVWKHLMLEPTDYGHKALYNQKTRSLMQKCTFEHGGKAYDEKYPEGIPTSIVISLKNGKSFDSKLVMFPAGHARNTTANLKSILNHKFNLLAKLSVDKNKTQPLIDNLQNL